MFNAFINQRDNQTMTAYRAYSDQQLAVLLKEGDRNAFTEIYERYYGLLYVHTRKRLKDLETAKDLVQELFADIWVKRSVFDLSVSVSGYLYRALRNRILNSITHQQVADKYVLSLQGFLDQEPVAADHLVREHQLKYIIEKEIAALPVKMRQVFELSRKANMSHKEIALELDLTEQTVRSHIKNALRILRIRLGLFAYLVFLLRF